MVWPTITPLPTAPRRGDAPATFSSNANAWVASLGTFTTQVNAAGAYIDLQVAAAEQAVIDAETAQSAAEAAQTAAEAAESVAIGTANYKGEWGDLVGALAIPASVSHNGVVWVLTTNLADVTASEPAYANSDWISATIDEAPIDGSQYARKDAGWELISVSGVDLTYTVASGKSVTAGRVIELVAGGVRDVEFSNGTPSGIIIGVAKTSQAAGESVAVAIGPVITTSGLSTGSEYYILNGGTVSATTNTGVKVGFAKSSTELVFRYEVTRAQQYKSMLLVNNRTPSVASALEFDFWKTREVKTSSGTFTVPAGVTMLGIFCLGAGANGSGTSGGGGGGLAMKTKAVTPGETIAYTISAGVASCDGMTANPGSTTGGSASGGTYNFSGGSTAASYGYGGGGCGQNCATWVSGKNTYGGGALGHWRQTSFVPYTTYANQIRGGAGMWHTDAVLRQHRSNNNYDAGGGFGAVGAFYSSSYSIPYFSGGLGKTPPELGIFVTTDITGNNNPGWFDANNPAQGPAGDWCGGAVGYGTAAQAGGLGAGGGYSSTTAPGGAGGLGGGGGASASSSVGGAGGLGGGGGSGSASGIGGSGGYGGGGGYGGTPGNGGSSVVIFTY